MEQTTAFANNTGTVQKARRRPLAARIESKTPECEMMSVDDYFAMVWNRYLEKYENLQG